MGASSRLKLKHSFFHSFFHSLLLLHDLGLSLRSLAHAHRSCTGSFHHLHLGLTFKAFVCEIFNTYCASIAVNACRSASPPLSPSLADEAHKLKVHGSIAPYYSHHNFQQQSKIGVVKSELLSLSGGNIRGLVDLESGGFGSVHIADVTLSTGSTRRMVVKKAKVSHSDTTP